MVLALTALGIVSLAELLLWLPIIWKTRKVLAVLLLVALVVITGWLMAERLAAWTILIGVLSVYRCLNLARIRAGRIHANHLFHTSRQTDLWLIGAQVAIAALAGVGYRYHIEPITWWYALAALQLAGAAIITGSTFRHIRTTRKPTLDDAAGTSSLPSLTVAIPARNETTDLETCLRSLTSSTYPKLEIIVLDDCSQNKRTPEIIREFAHDGVRFIAGTPPPGQWLAKNHAYSQLAAAANGELLLFCGVDTRFQPQSLTVLVQTLLQKQKSMISVLPKNTPPETWNIRPWFLQPSRYAWELALPRRLMGRPPVLSTCWLITKDALKAAGGFGAVKRRGVPESYFARTTAAVNDGYSFLRSDDDLSVVSQKHADDQKATAIRTRYLQLHRRPEMTAFIGFAELALLVWPLILGIAAAASGEWTLAGISGLAFLLQTVSYVRIANLTYGRFSFRGVWLMPLAAVYDIGLLNYSMWQYEFGEVLWKGRNVCLPVMRVIPELPKPSPPPQRTT